MRPSAGSFPFPDEQGTVWLAFVDWGDPDNDRVLVCVHGLTRQGRDFDELAKAVCRDFRVIEVDVAGRGRSGWLSNKRGYHFGTYLRHMDALFDYRALKSVDFIGTSMGGIIGMMMAAREESPIRRLILNDIGPEIPKQALETIAAHVGDDPSFASLNDAAAYLKEVHAGFGDLPEVCWSEMTQHSVSREANGRYKLHYDPAIGDVLREAPFETVDLWPLWERIQCPVLALRGATSEVLTPRAVNFMRKRGPCAEVIEIPGCGHAPSLMVPEQIELVHEWLLRDPFAEDLDEDGEGDEGGEGGEHAAG